MDLKLQQASQLPAWKPSTKAEKIAALNAALRVFSGPGNEDATATLLELKVRVQYS